MYFHYQQDPSARAVSVVSEYGLDNRGSIPGKGRTSASRPALGPAQPPIQWVPGNFSAGVKHGRGVMLTILLHLVLRLRMGRSYTSPPKRLHGV
jgi:hypothetical protein